MSLGELSEAAWSGDVEAVRGLLGAGVDPSVEDDSNTALYDALDEGHVGIAAVLLRGGADPMRAHPDFGDSALAAAWRGSGPEGIQLLCDHGVDPSPLLLQVARNDQPEVLRQLLQAGVDPKLADPQGWTALHFASAYGYAASVQVLLSAGSPADCATEDGLTPLAVAERNDHLEVGRLIEEHLGG